MRIELNPVMVISAHSSKESVRRNMERTMELEELLKENSFPYALAKGMYKSQIEDSFIVELCISKGTYIIDTLINLAKEFDQESVMYIDRQRNSFLYFTNKYNLLPNDDNTIPLGRLVNVSKEEALSQKAYTHNLVTDCYYITKEGL